jgi:hypothetical protein
VIPSSFLVSVGAALRECGADGADARDLSNASVATGSSVAADGNSMNDEVDATFIAGASRVSCLEWVESWLPGREVTRERSLRSATVRRTACSRASRWRIARPAERPASLGVCFCVVLV